MANRAARLLGVCAALLLTAASSAAAAPDVYPATKWSPSNLLAGQGGRVFVELNNRGNGPTTAPLKVQVVLPPNVKFTALTVSGGTWSCTGITTVTCTHPLPLKAYEGDFGPVFSPPELSPTWLMLDIAVGAGLTGTFPMTVTVTGGGLAQPGVETHQVTIGEEPLGFGIHGLTAGAFDAAGDDFTQAGGHPDEVKADFSLNVDKLGVSDVDTAVPAGGPVRDVVVDTPPGFLGDPTAVPRCPNHQFQEGGAFFPGCPDSSQVGVVLLRTPAIGNFQSAVYNVVPPHGLPAQFAFWTPVGPVRINPGVRSDGDYGLTTTVNKITQADVLLQSDLVLWGNPADPVHDAQRCAGLNVPARACVGFSTQGKVAVQSVPHPFVGPERAFLTMQTNCVEEPVSSFHFDTYDNPAPIDNLTDLRWASQRVTTPIATGCDQVPFSPSITLRPTSNQADSPTGLDVHVHFPREGDSDPDGLVQAHLKNTEVILPEGIRFNPGAADGLESCTLAQIGLTSAPGATPITFDNREPSCPDASKIGSGEVITPLLDQPLHGEVFLASQNQNPFNSTYAIYLVVREPSILVKLAGRIDVNRTTGQITSTFANSPQLPFSDLNLSFYGGPRASLATPVTCGSFTSQTTMDPWSSADPEHPTADEQVRSPDSFSISSGPGDSPCVTTRAARSFELGLAAGSRSPLAGATSPFSIRITRPDGAQEISSLDIAPPPGFTAYLKGVPYCPEAQIALAQRISGKAELAAPSCPAASQVGTTNVAAGPGSTPLFTPGRLYLAGPYRGAPLSVVAITPAVAGPFDLGNVLVRSALYVDPATARITAKTDPLPQILEGVPLAIREVRIDLDRPGWALNPTNCEAMAVEIAAKGISGAATSVSDHFQLSSCAELPFKPKLSFRLFGGTSRGAHPRFVATLTAKPREANIDRVAVTLPHSEFLEQGHIKTICTRVQFATKACPPASVYGKAEAITPLLDGALKGPVYLRSSSHDLPDLVAALRGPDNQPIEIELAGRVDSVHASIRNTFEVVPDAPVSKFVLSMQGGRKGLLVNSRSLCAKPSFAIVKLAGQNGKTLDQRVAMKNSCKPMPRKKKAKAGEHKRRPLRGFRVGF